MKITVQLYASLKQFAPDGGDDTFELDIPPMDVKELIRYLGIPEIKAGIVMINDKICDRLTEIQNNDKIRILTELMGG